MMKIDDTGPLGKRFSLKIFVGGEP